jgi:glutamine amidotransferase
VSPRRLAIVDYGVGNLRSVQKALEHAGAVAEITRDPARIAAAPGVVLPGQGAFGTCVQHLDALGLREPVRAAARSGRPFLGICVGMQLLFEGSDESPGAAGLGIFKGRVVRFPSHPDRKVPQIGWNQLRLVRRDVPALRDVADGAWVYFLHSYYPVPEEPDVAATTEYGVAYVSGVARGNVFAGVFHPEKSQRVGQALLRGFVDMLGDPS